MNSGFSTNSSKGICVPHLRSLSIHDKKQLKHEESVIFTVGVLANRGFSAAYDEFNTTFSDYLSETAGKRFNPPIMFQMKPLNFNVLFDNVENSNVDFLYSDPSAFSCIDSEYSASSLVSQISRRIVGGEMYSLNRFGGVIFTRADRDDINTTFDIKEKVIACASISDLGSGQMQFRELVKKGISYFQDVKQIVFTSNEEKVINGVLNGDFDIGFVRTDQIEQTKYKNDQFILKSQLKIIDAKPNLEIDGIPFPFESSTPLYGEWNLAALKHVPDSVSVEVQSAMLAVADHASIGKALADCYVENSCEGINSFKSNQDCKANCLGLVPETIEHNQTCLITPELALLANNAVEQGMYSGWRSSLSYMDLRNMQEETGFIMKNPETSLNRCVRTKEIYDAVICPEGFFRKTKEEILKGCKNKGLECKKGFECVCDPCTKAFEVDIFAKKSKNKIACHRFEQCGQVEQQKSIKFRAVDNKLRETLNISVKLFEGEKECILQAIPDPIENFTYDFEISTNNSDIGNVFFEIYADGKQISESPLRLHVTHLQNDINLNFIRWIGMSLSVMIVLCSLGFASWVFCNRKNRIVRKSQPFFLIMICSGTLIMAITLITLAIDDKIASERGCTIACNLSVWIFPIGFTITFSALFSKIRRINLIMHAANHFRRIKITAKDVLPLLMGLLVLNFIFLTIWSVLDPLHWKPSSIDSHGYCFSEGVIHKYMIGLLCLVNFAAIALANLESYKSRNISTEFSESHYIAFSMAAILQVSLIGIPLLALVQTPIPKYFIEIFMVSTYCFSILLLIFVPKIKSFYTDDNVRQGSYDRRSSLRIIGPGTHGGSVGSTRSFSQLNGSCTYGSARRKSSTRIHEESDVEDIISKIIATSSEVHANGSIESRNGYQRPERTSFSSVSTSFLQEKTTSESELYESCRSIEDLDTSGSSGTDLKISLSNDDKLDKIYEDQDVEMNKSNIENIPELLMEANLNSNHEDECEKDIETNTITMTRNYSCQSLAKGEVIIKGSTEAEIRNDGDKI